ncbi:sugar MFS transporter [Asaia krungthepensis]|uniref:Fucose permease n=1 Tax=Asaia krungthepensis NRIC 0535 TaxID=1307925 RepID=A0ABQ0Q5T8_9PROT|nr:sugar MFS transporter [Asaia krungthepensis]GBQ92759.1 fucose permease [Asaia krungthepensis NRIC 0535]
MLSSVRKPGAATSSVAALALLASVFFMWGFATVLNDILVPHLKAAFSLNYTASLLVQFCFYLGYLVISLPASRLVSALGYKGAVILGLVGMAVSCLLFIPASAFFSYGFFLVALFLLAAAITLLQVAANPYVVVIGDEASASSRLTMVQAFNSLGTTLAPLFGGVLIFARSHEDNAAGDAAASLTQRVQDAQMVQLPYGLIAIVLLIMAVIVWRFPLPAIDPGRHAALEHGDAGRAASGSVWRHRNLFWGVPAIFLYMICEIGIGSTLVNFISQKQIGNMSHAEAAHYVAFFWGGAMAGRFLGAALMRRVSPHLLLGLVSLAGALLILVVIASSGPVAMWALILTGLCHSIMFPTIFSLGIAELGPQTEQGAGWLIMAIAGGAAAIFQGVLADRIGLSLSYLLPFACYLYLVFYARWGSVPGTRSPVLQEPRP